MKVVSIQGYKGNYLLAHVSIDLVVVVVNPKCFRCLKCSEVLLRRRGNLAPWVELNKQRKFEHKQLSTFSV